MDSTGDDVNQLKNNYKNYVDAVVKAILEYIGISDDDNYYIVQKGNSLWSIAKKFGTTIDEIKRINNLTSNTLSVGQKLKIPKETSENNDNYTIYTVKSGDNLYSIAKNYGLTINDLIDYNNLPSTILSIGQKLKIPNKTSENNNNYIIYTVKSGDNLYSIARNYNLSIEDLMNYNNLTSNLLSIGQKLKIPMSTSGEIYTVKSGDTLYSIARKYNTTVDNLKKKNNLTSNSLSIGQRIII